MSEAHLPVSVIIPHHNRVGSLRRALASVQAQTCQPKEVVIVDDASRPEHRSGLNEFARVARVIYLERNVGAARARNIGMEVASQGLLTFLDDDDEWFPNKLETQWKLLNTDSTACAITSAVSVVDTITGSEIAVCHKRSRNEISIPMALEAKPALIQTLMIRASTMKELGGFDAAFRQLEDHEFFIRLAAEKRTCMHTSETLVRLHRNSGDHLTDHRLSFLVNQLRVVKKHRALYDSTFGAGGARAAKSKYIRREGIRRGGLVGRLIYGCGCMVGAAYEPLWTLFTSRRLLEVPYSDYHQ